MGEEDEVGCEGDVQASRAVQVEGGRESNWHELAAKTAAPCCLFPDIWIIDSFWNDVCETLVMCGTLDAG